MFSDQNFVPTLTAKEQCCIGIVRVENCSLLELYEMALEIFSNVIFPEGSVLMFGSASHLGRTGTSIYAKDWTEVVALCTGRWRGVRVCPLIPLIISECTGTIVRELSELTNWYSSVYDTSPLGFHDVWLELVAAMEEYSSGSVTLDVMDSYKLALPATLQSRTLDKTVTFCTNNSRPVTFAGIPKDRCGELLGSMLRCLFENFRACGRPEIYLARADVNDNPSENTGQKVTLVGASNLGQSRPYFTDQQLDFVGVTVPGWTPSPENIQNMVSAVEEKGADSVAFVFDLFGNSSVRFEQFDGTSSLPFKSNGKFHLAGKTVVTSSEIFRKTVENIVPIIRAAGNKPCVVIPPLPRYLFSRCCGDKNHCTNADDKDFRETLLAGFVHLKNELIKHLVRLGVVNFKVMDSCCVTACSTTANISDRLKELGRVYNSDGVHFNADGHTNLAQRTIGCLRTLLSTPRKKSNATTFFWRGFRSRRGSLANKSTVGKANWTGGGNVASNHVVIGSRGRAWGGSSRGKSPNNSRGYHPYRRR
jgi:lysophospholipase L1-like esterase